MSFNGFIKQKSHSETDSAYNMFLTSNQLCFMIPYVSLESPEGPQSSVTQSVSSAETKEWNKKLEKAEESLGCQVMGARRQRSSA